MSSNRRAAQLFISNFDPRLRLSAAKLEKLIAAVFQHLKIPHVSLSLIFVTDGRIKKLNRQYLNHSWATDVLAFPFENASQTGKHANLFLGEIIISPKRALVQSGKYQVTFENELARYVVHGILHLRGYRDKTARDFSRMHREEDKILKINSKLIKGLFRYGDSKR